MGIENTEALVSIFREHICFGFCWCACFNKNLGTTQESKGNIVRADSQVLRPESFCHTQQSRNHHQHMLSTFPEIIIFILPHLP